MNVAGTTESEMPLRRSFVTGASETVLEWPRSSCRRRSGRCPPSGSPRNSGRTTNSCSLVDHARDPAAVRAHGRPDVRLVVAGDPVRCSGKANAAAAGLEAATDDVLVRTDADFEHAADWLETITRGVERHGVATGIPVFVSRDLAGASVEPLTTPPSLHAFWFGGAMWGGAMGFRREQVDFDALCRALRRTVSDDCSSATAFEPRRRPSRRSSHTSRSKGPVGRSHSPSSSSRPTTSPAPAVRPASDRVARTRVGVGRRCIDDIRAACRGFEWAE